MPSCGWKSPVPFPCGGKADETCDAFYRMMQRGRPESLRGGEGTHVDIENKAIARMMLLAWRETQRRVAQRDPHKLAAATRPVKDPETGKVRSLSILERWETLLRIRPRPSSTLTERRAAVAGKLVSTTSTSLRAVEDAMRAVFGEWYHSIAENSVDDVDYAGKSPPGNVRAFWGDNATVFDAEYPGEYSASFPWASWLCHVAVVIQPPAWVEQVDVSRAVAKAKDVLDDMLPAWMTSEVSQLTSEQSEVGFYLDISPLDYTAL